MRIKLDIPLTVQEIATAVFGKAFTGENKTVEYITQDTRGILPNDLFIALEGENFDGEDFVDDALTCGAIAISAKHTTGCISVKSTKAALLKLCEYYLTRLTCLKKKICITGSVGKTTTKEFLAILCSERYKTHKTDGNLNNYIGVAFTVLSAPRDTEILVLEFGTNNRGEIRELSEAVHPTIAVITNIGTAHVGRLGSRQIIANEKLDIISGMADVKILCEYGETLIPDIKGKLTVSCENAPADFFLCPIKEDISGTTFDLYSQYGIIEGARLEIAGRHILRSLAMAISAALTATLTINDIMIALKRIDSTCARHKFVKLNGLIILDDSYNSSLESVTADLALLAMYKNHPRSALLGDILELGCNTEAIHREMGAVAYRSGIERLYLFGVYSHSTALGAIAAGMREENIFINTDTTLPQRTADDILSTHKKNEIILFKASHKVNLSRITDILKKKGAVQ